MIAVLYEIPDNPATLATWAAAHQAHHIDIARRVFETRGVQVFMAPLSPMDPERLDQWLGQHQQIHREMDEKLGITSSNLTDVDWHDRAKLTTWIQKHAQEHYQAGQILGV